MAGEGATPDAAPGPKAKRVYRRIDGFLLYDKPRGIGSNGALQHVRWLYRAERAGHTGTLDPLASGLLLICFGQATRFAGELLDAGKTYRADLLLGIRTGTGDAEGEVIAQKPVDCGLADIEAALARFRGDILQTPPMHSALKRDGVPLYRLARKGVEVPREPRKVTIYDIRLESVNLPEIRIRVSCSKGTYIRVLAEDIGEVLGCGAHLSRLERLSLGPFRLEEAVSEETLVSLSEEERIARLRPADELAFACPPLVVDGRSAAKFLQGQAIATAARDKAEYRIYDEGGRFLGTGESGGSGMLQPRRVMVPEIPGPETGNTPPKTGKQSSI